MPRVLLTPIQTLGSGQSGTVTKMATTLFCEPGETIFVAVKELNEQSTVSGYGVVLVASRVKAHHRGGGTGSRG